MSLLDAFYLQFGTEGLYELGNDVSDADKKLDKFEQRAKKTEKTVKDIGKAINRDGTANIKRFALQLTRAITPMVAFGKALQTTLNYAQQAIEVAEAAKEAGKTLEDFQTQDSNRYVLFSKEDVRAAKDFEMVMRDVRLGMASIGANLAQLLLPALTKLATIAKNVIDFFVDHGAFVKAVFIGLGVAITAFAIPSIVAMGTALWTALAPILPIIAAVAAGIALFALVVEDIYKWIHGEPSVAELLFGDFETFKNNVLNILNNVLEFFQPFIDTIKDLFSSIWELLKAIFNWAKDKSSGLFEGIGALIQNIISRFKQLGAIIQAVFEALPDWLKDFIRNGGLIGMALRGITSGAKKATEAVNGSHANGLDYVPFDGYIAELHKGERVQTASEASDWRSSLMAAKKAINFTASYPLNALSGGTISNAYSSSENSRTINIGDITIQTSATSAEGIANDLASAIKRAVISLDNGMLA